VLCISLFLLRKSTFFGSMHEFLYIDSTFLLVGARVNRLRFVKPCQRRQRVAAERRTSSKRLRLRLSRHRRTFALVAVFGFSRSRAMHFLQLRLLAALQRCS
jgi:hypothetical protein